ERGRSRAHAGDALAVLRCARQQLARLTGTYDLLGGVTLERSDGDGRAAMPGVVDARAHAQHLDRAHACAREAEHVGGENLARGAAHVVGAAPAAEGAPAARETRVGVRVRGCGGVSAGTREGEVVIEGS